MTSIEQFEQEFYSYAESCGVYNDKWKIDESELDRLFEKYKQKHKQEIIDAWDMGRFNIDDVGLGKEYYQETFEK